MSSLKYFLLSPFLLLCLTCTFATRVLDSDDGSILGSGSGAAEGGVSMARGLGGISSAGRGVDPVVNGLGVGVGVGYRPGFGPGPGVYWPGPRHGGGLYGDCTLGYVCPSDARRGCNRFGSETCGPYSFRPLMGSMYVHEVEINWAKGKHVATAQHGETEKAQHGETEKAQNGV